MKNKFEIDRTGYRGFVTMKQFSLGLWIEWRKIIFPGCQLYEDANDNNMITGLWGTLACIDDWQLEKEVDGQWEKIPRFPTTINPHEMDYKVALWLRAEPAQYVIQSVTTDPKV